MEQKNFKKNDNSFICLNCNKMVNKLGYTSRNHCPYCLHSIHIDINPGDRENDCLGIMQPIEIINDSKKGNVIVFKCKKCGVIKRNIMATDDNFELAMEINKLSYKKK